MIDYVKKLQGKSSQFIDFKYCNYIILHNPFVYITEDFMFEMNSDELDNWRTQFATSNLNDKMGLRYAPFCFTEQGVTMLSCVLNSQRAIAVNIQIIRIFTRMREFLLNHKDILLKLEQIEKQTTHNTEDIQLIFEYLKKLLTPASESPRKRVGYKLPNET